MREDEYTEFKREPTKQVAREVIAFANTHGGTLYLGVDDDGVPVGITDVDAAMLVVVNSVRDSVAPDVMPLIQVSVLSGEECEDLFGSVPKSGAVVRLAVGEGRRKPYCLARKGPVPEGVFVREGPSTASADSGRILEMIMEPSQTSFEDLPAGEDDLTFDSLRKSFSSAKLELGLRQMRTLGLRNSDGAYTNLGLMLSDQCPFSFQLASFQGTDVRIIKDRKILEGSVLSQLEQIFDYLEFRNETSGIITVPYRIETRSYPDDALREAVLNMVMHRDYGSPAINKASVFDDRIEFMTAGGLARGVRMDEVTNGTSVCRNPRLANVMFRLGMVEAYGMGLPRIFAAYSGKKVKPIVEVSAHVFKLTLPNLNYVREHGVPPWAEEGSLVPMGGVPRTMEQVPGPRALRPGDSIHMVMNIVESNGSITRVEVEKVLGISRSSAGRLLEGLVQEGKLKKVGSGRSSAYAVVA